MSASSEVAYLARALKALRVAQLAASLAERARSEGWDYEHYLVQVLGEEVGTVALAGVRARWTDPLGSVSHDQGQFSERVRKPRDGRYVGTKIVEAPAEVLDEGMAGDDDPRGTVSLQPSHGAKSSLQAPVVGLQRVVRMDLRLVEGRRQQLIQHTGVDPVPVGGDLHG